MFEVPFDAIAAILGRSIAATKMLASRARGRIRLGTPTAAPDAAAREVADAFFAAVGQGDLAGLLTVLAPGVIIAVRGRPVTVMAFTVTGGSITAIRMLTVPDRLAQIVPSWVA